MGRKKGDKTEAEKALDAAVLKVAQDTNFDGKAFATLVKALNAAGLKTITKKAWTEDNAAMHWKRHKLSVSHIHTTQDTTPQEPLQESQEPSLTDTHDVTQGETTENAGQVLQGGSIEHNLMDISQDEVKAWDLTVDHNVIPDTPYPFIVDVLQSETEQDITSDDLPIAFTEEGLTVDHIDAQHQGQAQDTEHVAQGTPVVLQADDMNDFMDMLTWWQGGGARGMQGAIQTPEVMVKPDFVRDETITKTIRLSVAMVEAAEKKARTQDKAVTHGSFSGLIEWLLWRYLDSSDEYLKAADDGEQ
ncbi:MAG: hypothetical protein V2B18_25210 [Pseudomonadota bacterium]